MGIRSSLYRSQSIGVSRDVIKAVGSEQDCFTSQPDPNGWVEEALALEAAGPDSR